MPEEPNEKREQSEENNFESTPVGAPTEPLAVGTPSGHEYVAVTEELQPQIPVVNTPTQTPQPSQTEPAVEPAVQTQIASANTPAQTVASVPNNPMTLVLQWLTYAFWGWTALSLSILTWLSIDFYVSQSSSEFGVSSTISYPLAAVLVLFAISFVCDSFYSKRESEHKTGAAMVIMVIHAVIFALFGIGWVISAVFGVISLAIGPEDSSNSGAFTTIATGVIIAVVYGATLLRTIRPAKIKNIRILYALFMAVITLVVAAMGIFGPVMNARETKDDRLIERGLSNVAAEVADYAQSEQKLPADLSEIRDSSTSDAKELIDRGLVTYTPGSEVARPERSAIQSSRFNTDEDAEKIFSYELCVTYKAEKGDDYGYGDEYTEGRDTTPDTYYHDAGRVCYDLVTGYQF